MGEVRVTEELELRFHQAMLNLYHAAVELGYRPTYFIQMVNELGGVGAARRLLSTDNIQAGLTRLWKMDRLDLSVEAHVLREPWKDLFSDDERREALERLEAYGYDPQSGR